MGRPYSIEFCYVIFGMSEMSRCGEIRIIPTLNANIPAAGLRVLGGLEGVNIC